MKIYRGYIVGMILFCTCKITFSQEQDSIASMKWMDTIADPKERSIQYTKISLQQNEKGNREAFKKYNDSALYIATYYNLPGVKIDALNNIGKYYLLNDEYEQALSIHQKALKICDELMPATAANKVDVLNSIAHIYNKIGLFEKAIVTAEQMLSLSKSHHITGMKTMSAYNILGNGYKRLEKYEKALEYLHKLNDYGEQANNKKAIVTAQVNIINIYYNMQDYDSTIKAATRFLESYPDIEKGKLEAIINLGMAYVKKKDGEKAIPYLVEAKERAISQNRKQLLSSCHFYLAEAYALTGNFKESHKEQKAYSEINKTLTRQRTDANIRDVRHEAEKEKEVVKQKLASVINGSGKKDKILTGSSIILVFLGGMLFFYVKRKKSVEQESEKIKQNYAALYDEHLALKTKLKELAENREKEYADDERQAKASPQYKNSSLTQEDREHYMDLILDYMEKEKPYLDFDINQSELASKLSMSSHHLSEVLSICFEQNFYNFINIYRVNEAQRLMKNPKYNDYKILAIAYESGFKSKTSFNRVFKNHIGLTPTEYRNNNVL